jgi:zinc transporter ZupT
MEWSYIILFLIGFLPAVLVYFIGAKQVQVFKYVLSFSGAYLFSITIIHLLPEALSESGNIKLAGVFVLIGYFLQMMIEYFTTGVEHGHVHFDHHHHGHGEKFYILIAMCLHGLLEGTLLLHPSEFHAEEDHHSLLIGLVMHKLPEAFALAMVLMSLVEKKIALFGWQLIFALASPIGLLVSDELMHSGVLNESYVGLLFALVAGNFLYISTTIFFESNPHHKFKAKRLGFALIGAVMAVLMEML